MEEIEAQGIATWQHRDGESRAASGLLDVDAVDETGYGLGWDLETVALAGEQTRVVGHDGKVMGGMLASLMTFHERGIVVSVTSNISFTDTFALALRFAQAFAEQARSPARK